MVFPCPSQHPSLPTLINMASLALTVLRNADIVPTVVAYLIAQNDHPHRSLLHFGLICKATNEVAMETSWHTVNDPSRFSYLFSHEVVLDQPYHPQCNPCDALHWGHNSWSCPFRSNFTAQIQVRNQVLLILPNANVFSQSISSPLTTTLEWDRFTLYASRVKKLVLVQNVTSRLFDKMNISRPPGPLFPHLHTLEFSTHNPRVALYLPLFFSPSIRHLHLVGVEMASLEHDQNIARNAPCCLETFSIREREDILATIPSGRFTSFPSLSLSPSLSHCHLNPLIPITSDDLRRVLALPKLRSLGMCMGPTHTPLSLLNTLTPREHPLSELHLCCSCSTHIPILTCFLNTLVTASSSLRHISLSFPVSTKGPQLQPLFELLPRFSFLISVEIAFLSPPIGEFPHDRENLAFDQPPLVYLLSLRELTQLSTYDVPLLLDASLPDLFSSHWPNLAKLSFSHPDQRLTLLTFYRLVSLCPNLCEALIPLISSLMMEDAIVLLQDLPIPVKRPIFLSDGPSMSPFLFAYIVHSMFPFASFIGDSSKLSSSLSNVKDWLINFEDSQSQRDTHNSVALSFDSNNFSNPYLAFDSASM